MSKRFFLVASAGLLLTACENQSMPNAENTGRNVRDRSSAAMTPGEQGENNTDLTITQNIRRAIMDDDSLSENAKNIKIVTVNGVVTLRGPVNSQREKNEIAKKAQAISGVRNVDNQLEIAQGQ